MSDVDWQGCIDIVGNDGSGNSKTTLSRAARKLGIKERLLRALYYRETREPKFSIGVALINAAKAQADRYEAIAASLEGKNADFFRDDIHRYRALAGRIRRLGG